MRVIYKPQLRKSIGIYPYLPDIAEVRYPMGMPKQTVDEFTEKHREWAEATLQRLREENAATVKIGSTLPYMGKELPVIPAENGLTRLLPGEYFRLTREYAAADAQKLYRTAAVSILPKKAEHFARLMGVGYSGVKINGARTRWGSCGGHNSLNFSFFLMTAPESAIDYVVIHELAHTVHHNHGPEFWSLVEKYCPDYKEQKKILVSAAQRCRSLGIG